MRFFEQNLQEKQEIIQQLETSNVMFKDLMLKEQEEKSKIESNLKIVFPAKIFLLIFPGKAKSRNER